ncbi:MAG: CAP domain-containing protein [Pirellulales bacterium]|nr:CAP domain-containing protein [Pirellulales bacterium]
MNWIVTRGQVLGVVILGLMLTPSASAVAQDNQEKQDKAESKKFAMWPIEEQLIEYTNKERERHGLPPIAMDESLVKSARQHAWWMVRANTLQHTSAPVAENIAMGQRTASEVVRDWMNSPGHRANMLGNYTRIGAAAYQTKGETCYWCLQFLR